MAQPARRSEVEHPRRDPPIEGNSRIAERTECDCHRSPADVVVDDLVPDEDLKGVGLGLLTLHQEDDGFARGEPGIGLTAETKRGWSRDGIPSLGGPPETISSSGTVWREKSVRHDPRV